MFIVDNVINVFEQMWPMVVIVSVVLISIRITDVIINKKKFHFVHDTITYFFLLYVLMLFHVVTFYNVDWTTYNFNLFQGIMRYEVGSALFYQIIVGNIVLFIPFGMFVTYYLNLSKIRIVLFLALLVSASIETTQFFIGRVSDVDDILLNVIGAGLGYCIYDVGRKINRWMKGAKR